MAFKIRKALVLTIISVNFFSFEAKAENAELCQSIAKLTGNVAILRDAGRSREFSLNAIINASSGKPSYIVELAEKNAPQIVSHVYGKLSIMGPQEIYERVKLKCSKA